MTLQVISNSFAEARRAESSAVLALNARMTAGKLLPSYSNATLILLFRRSLTMHQRRCVGADKQRIDATLGAFTTNEARSVNNPILAKQDATGVTTTLNPLASCGGETHTMEVGVMVGSDVVGGQGSHTGILSKGSGSGASAVNAETYERECHKLITEEFDDYDLGT